MSDDDTPEFTPGEQARIDQLRQACTDQLNELIDGYRTLIGRGDSDDIAMVSLVAALDRYADPDKVGSVLAQAVSVLAHREDSHV